MAATYTATQLKTSPLFRARFQLGDTGTLKDPNGVAAWLLQNEEIQAMIDLWGYAEGVAQCADALATRYAQEPDEYEDEAGVKVKWSQKIRTWQGLAQQLRAGVARTNALKSGTPYLSQANGPDMKGVRP